MKSTGQQIIHVLPGEGQMRWVVGDLVTFKISGEDAAGAFTLGEEIIPPQGGPPPHTHTREDETFYVLEGELEFVVGGRTISAAAGSVVYGPRGIVHSFRNVGSTPSRMVVIITPAGLEEFFEEVGEPVTDPSSPPDGPPDIEKLVAVARKYGIEIPAPTGDSEPPVNGTPPFPCLPHLPARRSGACCPGGASSRR
jgi:quercetin dioxygenase-like cupin family protein